MSNVQGSKLNYGKAIFLSPDVTVSPQLSTYHPLSRISLAMIYASKTQRVFIPEMMMMKLSLPQRQMLHECPSIHPSRASQDASVFNVDAIIREVNKSGARMTGEFNSLYDLINERGGDATPLKSKVKRLIHQACDLKDLQESYSDRMTTKVRESHLIEVGSKLNEASYQLEIKSTRYNALKTKLEQVDSRHKELWKGFCQAVASRDLLQEAEWAVLDLKGQIDTLNAIEVIDPATKASLEKTEAYVKESFEDLKSFQWKP
ncbi:hypothetical protein Cgig2_033471 [Carnegiea gigantea]|uniref:Uncharacterized protein n=1 Tax=Carnegiea gigantea TaxID=171969 RepID=A0A9Q1JGT1_9CARY|nr:hypothetical protein Cgig2_033471 [Carnegiea gigantea]